MSARKRRHSIAAGFAAAAAVIALAAPGAMAQSRIKTMPGYAQWSEISPQIFDAVKSGAVTPVWARDSQTFDYVIDGVRWRYHVALKRALPVHEGSSEPQPAGPVAQPATSLPTGGLVLARGRGKDADVLSPDGTMRAFSRDQNMWLAPLVGGEEKQLTTDGGAAARIRHGVGSYVYLEEFAVSQPVWWSPDGKKLAWMRYDETKVPDYFVPARPDEDAVDRADAGLSACGRREPRRRSGRLRCRQRRDDGDGHARGQALRQRCGRPLCVGRAVDQGRIGNPRPAGRSPAENSGPRRLRACNGQVPQRGARKPAGHVGAGNRAALP